MAADARHDIGAHGYTHAPLGLAGANRELAEGELKRLPIKGGGERIVTMYLILADPEGAGPGVKRLAEILRALSKNAE